MCYCTTDDGPEFCTETHPTARKQHECCECGSVIDPGEKYWNLTGMWDKFQTFKTCETCHNITLEAYDQGVECIDLGCLYETVGSEFEEAGII